MKLVKRSDLAEVFAEIAKHKDASFDVETTGKYPYHGDRIFSFAITTSKESYYFNFNEYPNLPESLLLDKTVTFLQLEELFKGDCVWYMHNALFDLAFIHSEEISIPQNVHCTYIGERVCYNERNSYKLGDLAHLVTGAKDDKVDAYIKEKGLYGAEPDLDGSKKKRFDLVPFDIIAPYAVMDAEICFKLGRSQVKRVYQKTAQTNPIVKPLTGVLENEKRLQQTIFNMTSRGTKVDTDYCKAAIRFHTSRMRDIVSKFELETGETFLLSSKLFERLFETEKELWGKTKLGNASFKSDTLESLENPLAKMVVNYKKSKSEVEFYKKFVTFSDKDGIIHTNFNAGATRTGRFSSSSPNLQNLKKDSDLTGDAFIVRRAIIPRKGFLLAMLDFDQIEYRMMLDHCNAKELINKIITEGLDVHQATANLSGCTRSQAKTVNFLTLYGGGKEKLASDLGVSIHEAVRIQNSIFDASPEIRVLINAVVDKAETHGEITNWFGRVYYFPKRNLSYKAPNTLIQGGAADVIKIAMNNIDDYLKDKKSALILTIHDELVFEIHEDEEHIIGDLKAIMESAYPYRYLPLTCGVEISRKSLADKETYACIKSSHGKETRNAI